eukprot:187683-Amorphochlora_amoeboformis.AAC.1
MSRDSLEFPVQLQACHTWVVVGMYSRFRVCKLKIYRPLVTLSIATPNELEDEFKKFKAHLSVIVEKDKINWKRKGKKEGHVWRGILVA